jgi:hypothetical protein
MSSPPAIADLLIAWRTHAATGWAAERFDHLARCEPERGWACIEALCAQTMTRAPTGSVAAGPLWYLIREDGARFIDRIERLAAENETFRACLRSSIGFGDDPEIARRCRAAAGITWVRDDGSLHPNVRRFHARCMPAPFHRGDAFAGVVVTRNRDPRDPPRGSLVTAIDGRPFASHRELFEILARLPEGHEPVLAIEPAHPVLSPLLDGWAPEPAYDARDGFAGLRVTKLYATPAAPHLAVPVRGVIAQINGVRVVDWYQGLELLTRPPDLASVELTLASEAELGEAR